MWWYGWISFTTTSKDVINILLIWFSLRDSIRFLVVLLVGIIIFVLVFGCIWIVVAWMISYTWSDILIITIRALDWNEMILVTSILDIINVFLSFTGLLRLFLFLALFFDWLTVKGWKEDPIFFCVFFSFIWLFLGFMN